MQILICRAVGDGPNSLPQAAKLPVQGKVDFPENACIVPGKTDEVVLLEGSAQTIVTAGGKKRPHPTRPYGRPTFP